MHDPTSKRRFINWRDIKALAEENKFFVTSTVGGSHVRNSKHYRGLAIDVRTRDKTPEQCESFMQLCQHHGLIVRDERTKPPAQKIWSGAHIHIEIK
jgi:hypothetical protein